MSEIEIIEEFDKNKISFRVVLFDFDGTISTLRTGWEEIMEPLMIEMISGLKEPDPKIRKEVKEFIEESTGIQTIYQMEWLTKKVEEYGLNPIVMNKWDYKKEYNRRLLNLVNWRIQKIKSGEMNKEDFVIKGSYQFLEKLEELGLDLYLISGTDHPDVLREAEILGINKYFKKIAGASVDKEVPTKKAVIEELLSNNYIDSDQLLVIGDGKVEINLARRYGAIALGMATDEIRREGINLKKRERLIAAGAHAIAGDFIEYEKILKWMGFL